MAAKEFNYTKISQLPTATTVADDDVLVINHSGTTSKITYAKLLELINTKDQQDLTTLTQRVATLETANSSLGTRVTSIESDNKTRDSKISTLESTTKTQTTDINTNKNNITALTTKVTDAEGTIDNIITAGFNLISIDVKA